MRFSSKLIMVCVVLLLTISPVLAKKYINGIDPNYPPFAYIDKDGNPSGFDVEAINWIAKKMNFEVEHRPMAWEGIIPSLTSKKIDFICSGMTITDERKKAVDFTDVYWTVKNVFVLPKDSKLTKDEILNTGKKLGMQQGTSDTKWMKDEIAKKNLNVTLRFYDSAPMIIEDLLAGRIDAGGMNYPPAMDAEKNRPVKIGDTFGEHEDFGCAIRKDDKELKAMLNEGFKELKASKEWDILVKKYLK